MPSPLTQRLAPTAAVSVITDSWLGSAVKRWGGAAVGTLAVGPLATLYLEGPTMLGMWGGASPETICAQLTSVPAEHWVATAANMDECSDTIHRHFNSWLVLGGVTIYFVVIAGVLWRCVVGGRRHSHPLPPQIVVVPHPSAVPPPPKKCV